MAQETPNKKTEETPNEEVVIPKVEDFDEELQAEQKTPEDSPTEEEVQDPIEEKAREMGWVPKEEYKGDPETWVDAKEFVGRAPLFEAIHQSKRENKKLEREIEKLKKFHKAVYEKAKEDAIRQLRKEYEEAADSNDIKTALKIKEEIDKKEKETFEEVQEDAPVSTEQNEENQRIYNEWVKDNKWYEEDEDIHLYATAYGYKLLQKDPDLAYKDMLDAVAKKVKEKFPEKFGEESPRKRAPAVSRPSTSGKESGKSRDPKTITIHHLPEDVRSVYRTMVKSKNNPGAPLEHDEFIKQYLEIGGELVK